MMIAAAEDQPVTTGQTRSYCLSSAVAGQLRVVLVWTDYPGFPAALLYLVSNLDLIVLSGGGSTLSFGNGVRAGRKRAGLPPDRIAPQQPDFVNNVEVVTVSMAAGDDVRVVVDGVNVPVGYQRFSLIFLGPPGMSLSSTCVGMLPCGRERRVLTSVRRMLGWIPDPMSRRKWSRNSDVRCPAGDVLKPDDQRSSCSASGQWGSCQISACNSGYFSTSWNSDCIS